jgi:putative colanic acid biosynthesis UDP-glucose lipid carrier transferase
LIGGASEIDIGGSVGIWTVRCLGVFVLSERPLVTDIRDLDRHSIVVRGVTVDESRKSCVLTVPRDTYPEERLGEVDRLEAGARRLARSKLKRWLDIFGSILGIVCLSPLLLLVALAIVVESPGSPLFQQRRSGFLGGHFVIYKFRTMRVREDGSDVVQAQRDDDRITRVGLFLRRTSIDELPQLLNVLKGEMSLVGPRPHAVVHDEYYGRIVADYDSRFKTKPGLTGLAQVSGLRGQTAEVRDMAARVDKDLEYIRSWSFLGDIKILLRTVLIFAYHPAAY